MQKHFWDLKTGSIAADTWNLWTCEKIADRLFRTEKMLRETGDHEEAISDTLALLHDHFTETEVFQDDGGVIQISKTIDDKLDAMRAKAARAVLGKAVA